MYDNGGIGIKREVVSLWPGYLCMLFLLRNTAGENVRTIDHVFRFHVLSNIPLPVLAVYMEPGMGKKGSDA